MSHLSPERLAEEITLHGRCPVTWLIGAGFSHSAGIPLSAEVWQLLLIAWLARHRNRMEEGAAEEAQKKLLSAGRGILPLSLSPAGPAGPLSALSAFPRGTRASVDDLAIPEEIGTDSAHVRDDLLRALSELRDRATPLQRAALSPGAEGAATYQTVFDLAAPTPESRRSFLRTLLSVCAAGPNLSHLLLAALLCEDRGPRMHTVFTVNFDDLLLESLLLQRKAARVFGDPQDMARPLLCPQAAQIVHLHGREAGYLQQGTEMISRDEWFYEHLRESSLIVCGYGGGDEQVMATIRRWLRSEMAGHLYWVLFHESEVEVMERRLCGLSVPRDRVRLVYRSAKQSPGVLSADDLMMELCAHLLPARAPGAGTVSDFLSDLVRENGHRLQGALLQLCRDHPQRDPLAEQLRSLHGKTTPAERQQHLLLAAELAHKGDVPQWRALFHLAQMREHFLLGQVAEAQVAAETALSAAEEIRHGHGQSGGEVLRSQILGLCGELSIWVGQLDLGRRHLHRLLRDHASCPTEWREEARHVLLSAVLRACQASRLRDSALLTEARSLLDLSIDTPVSAVRCLYLEAELYLLQGDLRRAVLVYESADEVAQRHVAALFAGDRRGTPQEAVISSEGLDFASPAPSEEDSEAALIRAARQARFGLLLCRVAAARDTGNLPDGFLSDVEEFTTHHPIADSEGQWMAATLWHLSATADPTRLRRAEEFAEGSLRLLGPKTPPWRFTQILRTTSAVALLAGKFDEAERDARKGQQHARRAEQYDEEARMDLLLSQIYRERGRRGNDDERQRSLRRAVAHAEVAWLRGLELGSTWLTEEADDLLQSLRATPTDIVNDVTPVPNPE